MALLGGFQKLGQRAFEFIEAGFNPVFGRQNNPLYHLGALSFYFYWIIAVSGLYLYIFFETSITAAYDSIEYLTVEQWYLGGVMRSLHRYASDALVISMILHMTKMFFYDRYRNFRVFSWMTGIPLLWFAFASGINGYWLVWDELAQYVAISTSELLDWLPIFAEPMARNFLNEVKVSDRFFSLLSFLHIGIPLFMLMVMWVHIQRVSKAESNPPRVLAIGSLLAMIVLSFIKPAVSQPPANLDVTVTTVDFDWFYLWAFPLLDLWSAAGVWYLLGGVSVFMTLLPWMPRRKQAPVAVVDPPNCNGCRRCYEDCPYNAIEMVKHVSWAGHQMAVVKADQCASCGICAGSCPSSTPFRSVEELVSGIDMPALTVNDLRNQFRQAAETLSGEAKVFVIGCDHAADVSRLQGEGVATFSLPCAANLPPAFVDYVYRNKWADGVLITGCYPDNCEFRQGGMWTEQRFAQQREPHLRTKLARERTRIFWASPIDGGKLARALDEYRAELIQGVPAEAPAEAPVEAPVEAEAEVETKEVRHG